MSSKPTFNLINVNATQSNMRGGYSHGQNYTNTVPMNRNNASTEPQNDELYLYKAKKYHYKCQQKLTDLKQKAGSNGQSWKCPSGYEKYLLPFSG